MDSHAQNAPRRQLAVAANALGVRYESDTDRLSLRDVTVSIQSGTCTALVGESGSGKTTLGRAIAGMLPTSAEIVGDLAIHGSVAYMPQDAVSALNPIRRVSWQLAQVLKARRIPRSERRARSVELLGMAGLPDPEAILARYPHELSGGLAQRVILATILATESDVLVADEPTSALDVTTQRVVMELLRSLVDERGMTLILITHDLRSAARVADRVAVIYRGDLVEEGNAAEVLAAPRDAYTAALVAVAGLEVPDDPSVRPETEKRS